MLAPIVTRGTSQDGAYGPQRGSAIGRGRPVPRSAPHQRGPDDEADDVRDVGHAGRLGEAGAAEVEVLQDEPAAEHQPRRQPHRQEEEERQQRPHPRPREQHEVGAEHAGDRAGRADQRRASSRREQREAVRRGVAADAGRRPGSAAGRAGPRRCCRRRTGTAGCRAGAASRRAGTSPCSTDRNGDLSNGGGDCATQPTRPPSRRRPRRSRPTSVAVGCADDLRRARRRTGRRTRSAALPAPRLASPSERRDATGLSRNATTLTSDEQRTSPTACAASG